MLLLILFTFYGSFFFFKELLYIKTCFHLVHFGPCNCLGQENTLSHLYCYYANSE